MDSLRHCLASSSKPQLFSSRKCSQYWLMAVSSLRRPLLRYSMTFASPCMMHSRGRGPHQDGLGKVVQNAKSHYRQEQPTDERAGRGRKRYRVSGSLERELAVDVLMRPCLAVRASGMA